MVCGISMERIWGPEFSPFLFQFVSKRFETSESLDLVILTCFNLFQSIYYKNYICFKVLKHQIIMGSGIFTFFMFQFVLKRFETIESVDLEICSLFQFVSVVLLYNLYVSKHQIWGLEFSPFYDSVCFETFRNN